MNPGVDVWREFGLEEPMADDDGRGWTSVLLRGIRPCGTVTCDTTEGTPVYTVTVDDATDRRAFAACVTQADLPKRPCRDCRYCNRGVPGMCALNTAGPAELYAHALHERYRWNASPTPVYAAGPDSNWWYVDDPGEATRRWDVAAQDWAPITQPAG